MSDEIDYHAPLKLKLFRLNQITGIWEYQRSADNAAHGYDWYEIYQKDEPKGLFYLGKARPGYKQAVRAMEDPEHWRKWYAPRTRATRHARTR